MVCLNEIKMGAMAKAVMYPGSNTLLMNLVSSFSDDAIEINENELEVNEIETNSEKIVTSSTAWIE